MNVKELRIGNYVIDNGEICEVIQIESNGNVMTTCKSKFPISNVGDLEPVKLTEKLILDCGFKKSSEYVYEYEKDCLLLFDAPNDWENTIEYPIGIEALESNYFLGYISHGEIVIRCLYLHDMQNKFFAISGNELKVNLPTQVLFPET